VAPPLVQWLLAIPHLMIASALRSLRQVLTLISFFTVLFTEQMFIGACGGIIAGFFAVLVTGEYPQGIRDFLVNAYRYSLRVEAYVGFLTDRYPPFSLAA
jgi:uncharacterized protein DUF4389